MSWQSRHSPSAHPSPTKAEPGWGVIQMKSMKLKNINKNEIFLFMYRSFVLRLRKGRQLPTNYKQEHDEVLRQAPGYVLIALFLFQFSIDHLGESLQRSIVQQAAVDKDRWSSPDPYVPSFKKIAINAVYNSRTPGVC